MSRIISLTTNQENLATNFYNYFDVEAKFEKHREWKDIEQAEIKNRLALIVARLRAKKLTREIRTSLCLERNQLREKVHVNDPRREQVDKFDQWLVSINEITDDLSKPEINDIRAQARTALRKAVYDTESFIQTGMAPFIIDFERSSNYFAVKTVEDYLEDYMDTSGIKTVTTVENKKSYLENLIEVAQEYIEIPEHLKAQAKLMLQTTLDIQINIAKVMDKTVQQAIVGFRKDLLQDANLSSLFPKQEDPNSPDPEASH